jgi:hypothetical protein
MHPVDTVLEGELGKKGERFSNWGVRFFSFNRESHVLEYFDRASANRSRPNVSGTVVAVTDVDDRPQKRQHRFTITLRRDSMTETFNVEVAATTAAEKARWVQGLSAPQKKVTKVSWYGLEYLLRMY